MENFEEKIIICIIIESPLQRPHNVHMFIHEQYFSSPVPYHNNFVKYFLIKNYVQFVFFPISYVVYT